jgi:hypothetical protein
MATSPCSSKQNVCVCGGGEGFVARESANMQRHIASFFARLQVCEGRRSLTTIHTSCRICVRQPSDQHYSYYISKRTRADDGEAGGDVVGPHDMV